MANSSAYNRAYYLAHREAIRAKNDAWNEEHRERVNESARLRRARRRGGPPSCVDCGALLKPLSRALRCKRCYDRHRYATDPDLRRRRSATMQAWLARRRLKRPAP